jgi:hypothetical protein
MSTEAGRGTLTDLRELVPEHIFATAVAGTLLVLRFLSLD